MVFEGSAGRNAVEVANETSTVACCSFPLRRLLWTIDVESQTIDVGSQCASADVKNPSNCHWWHYRKIRYINDASKSLSQCPCSNTVQQKLVPVNLDLCQWPGWRDNFVTDGINETSICLFVWSPNTIQTPSSHAKPHLLGNNQIKCGFTWRFPTIGGTPKSSSVFFFRNFHEIKHPTIAHRIHVCYIW